MAAFGHRRYTHKEIKIPLKNVHDIYLFRINIYEGNGN